MPRRPWDSAQKGHRSLGWARRKQKVRLLSVCLLLRDLLMALQVFLCIAILARSIRWLCLCRRSRLRLFGSRGLVRRELRRRNSPSRRRCFGARRDHWRCRRKEWNCRPGRRRAQRARGHRGRRWQLGAQGAAVEVLDAFSRIEMV